MIVIISLLLRFGNLEIVLTLNSFISKYNNNKNYIIFKKKNYLDL